MGCGGIITKLDDGCLADSKPLSVRTQKPTVLERSGLGATLLINPIDDFTIR